MPNRLPVWPWLLLAGCALVLGCEREEQPAELVVPPAEQRPPHVKPSIKWLPESPRYQQARKEVYRKGTDFTARLDLDTTRLSRRELYRVTIKQRPEPALQQMQSWLLHVETVDGEAVSGATLNVKGGMPQHGHGLPTLPQVSAATTPGDYLVEGLQFNMPGWWEVSLYISQAQREDTVTFNTVLH